MQDTEMTFSGAELAAISDRQFFDLKSEATRKIYALLGALEKEITQLFSAVSFPGRDAMNIQSGGKIYRGENYRGYPYVLLDCPRQFTAQSIFAFRSMFWWGNEFSFTFHLQGAALEALKECIEENIARLAGKDFFICTNDTPWEYYFSAANYSPLDDFLQAAQNDRPLSFGNRQFLKLSRRLPLNEYADAVSFGTETFRTAMGILNTD